MTTLVTWEVQIKPGLWDEAAAFNLKHLPDTRNFPGCRSIDLYRETSDPDRLMLIEYWDSAEDYHKYVAWRRQTGVLGDFLTLCAGDPLLRFFDLVDG